MQVLDLIFVKEDGKTVVFSIDNPITPVNEHVINQVMDTILSSSVFSSIGENTCKVSV
ncbi:potassium channel protein [Bacillus cereus]|nr:potassium channel protein [Bacillus cereus]